MATTSVLSSSYDLQMLAALGALHQLVHSFCMTYRWLFSTFWTPSQYYTNLALFTLVCRSPCFHFKALHCCLDVKAGDVLLIPGIEDPVTPIVEGEIELQGTTYPILRPQPLPHTFRWDDEYLLAKSRLFCLNDVGHGEHLYRQRSGPILNRMLPVQLYVLRGRRIMN
jgi:hypothetical protein